MTLLMEAFSSKRLWLYINGARVSWLSCIALSANHLATSQLSKAIGGSPLQLEKNPKTENAEILPSLVK